MRCRVTDGLIRFRTNDSAAVGIGTMIIFIAMILVAGIAASVLLQTMDNLEGQAVQTGRETISDISTGLKVTQVSGFQIDRSIDRIAIIISPIAGSAAVDVSQCTLVLSDLSKQVFFSYNQSCFNGSISNGLFQSLNSSQLNADEFGIIVIRDSDASCSALRPVIDSLDSVAIIVNSTKAFSGILPRVELSGSISPESGLSGRIRCVTPTSFISRIIELQP